MEGGSSRSARAVRAHLSSMAGSSAVADLPSSVMSGPSPAMDAEGAVWSSAAAAAAEDEDSSAMVKKKTNARRGSALLVSSRDAEVVNVRGKRTQGDPSPRLSLRVRKSGSCGGEK